jgi:hypothetical protein
MTSLIKGLGMLTILGILAASALPRPAAAITVELAKKCREMALKAHPSQRIGSKTGSAQAQRNYYEQCIAKDGKMDN